MKAHKHTKIVVIWQDKHAEWIRNKKSAEMFTIYLLSVEEAATAQYHWQQSIDDNDTKKQLKKLSECNTPRERTT